MSWLKPTRASAARAVAAPAHNASADANENGPRRRTRKIRRQNTPLYSAKQQLSLLASQRHRAGTYSPPNASGLTHAEVVLGSVVDVEMEFKRRAVADEVRDGLPVGRAEIKIVLDRVALIGRSLKTEHERCPRHLRREDRHRGRG